MPDLIADLIAHLEELRQQRERRTATHADLEAAIAAVDARLAAVEGQLASLRGLIDDHPDFATLDRVAKRAIEDHEKRPHQHQPHSHAEHHDEAAKIGERVRVLEARLIELEHRPQAGQVAAPSPPPSVVHLDARRVYLTSEGWRVLMDVYRAAVDAVARIGGDDWGSATADRVAADLEAAIAAARRTFHGDPS